MDSTHNIALCLSVKVAAWTKPPYNLNENSGMCNEGGASNSNF